MCRIALAQINPHVGALQENLEKMVAFARQAEASQADLILFPELSLTGYPPEDLLLRPGFLGQVPKVEQRCSSSITLERKHILAKANSYRSKC